MMHGAPAKLRLGGMGAQNLELT
ncbi:hypothetical protein SBA5_10008 [Candidatus Sulfotelmatomonas gaucii]|uniref:Uncharacterized protein n=1 Tax=Candidatus Sulfuritelmatomonas gaucii TaxID=2043161 RepID=A0A2N9L1W4_9BACT|nr:hypothetical protein SBA5_10008 [Candidatus Sulfotelmatomonas gaucii]